MEREDWNEKSKPCEFFSVPLARNRDGGERNRAPFDMAAEMRIMAPPGRSGA